MSNIITSGRPEPMDYRSTQSLSLNDPFKHPDYVKPQGKNYGTRKKLNEDKLKKEIEENFNSENTKNEILRREVDYTTDAKAAYKGDLNFMNSSLKVNDPTVRVPTYNSDYSFDNPITYYSYEIKNNQKCNFPMTFVRSSNPFRKSCSFSNGKRFFPPSLHILLLYKLIFLFLDIKYSIGKAAETHEYPNQLPISVDFTNINNMVSRFLRDISSELGSSKIPGSAVALILATIYDLELSYDGFCDIETLKEKFYSSLGLEISPAEGKSILITYALNDKLLVNLGEFSFAFRPMLKPRRLELVEIAFYKCDSNGSGFISESDMQDCFNAQGFSNYLGENYTESTEEAKSRFMQSIQLYFSQRGVIDVNDFIDYYCSVSAEIVDDKVFESLIRSQWLI